MSVMVDNKYDRRVRNRKLGKLDLTRLPKSATGSVNIFTKKEARKNKEYNIVILVDCSGSMTNNCVPDARYQEVLMTDPVYAHQLTSFSNSPKAIAVHCATVIDKHFHKIGLETAIIGFSDHFRVIKPLGKHRKIEVMHKELMGYGRGGTATDEALDQGYKMLKGKQGQNIVIVLTDGQPDSISKVKYIIKKNPLVKTIGVGIGIDARKLIKGITVNKIDELYPKFIKLLEDNIKRG